MEFVLSVALPIFLVILMAIHFPLARWHERNVLRIWDDILHDLARLEAERAKVEELRAARSADTVESTELLTSEVFHGVAFNLIRWAMDGGQPRHQQEAATSLAANYSAAFDFYHRKSYAEYERGLIEGFERGADWHGTPEERRPEADEYIAQLREECRQRREAAGLGISPSELSDREWGRNTRP